MTNQFQKLDNTHSWKNTKHGSTFGSSFYFSSCGYSLATFSHMISTVSIYFQYYPGTKDLYGDFFLPLPGSRLFVLSGIPSRWVGKKNVPASYKHNLALCLLYLFILTWFSFMTVYLLSRLLSRPASHTNRPLEISIQFRLIWKF